MACSWTCFLLSGHPLDLQVYLSFLSHVLKTFHEVVLLLDGENGTVCELYEIMLTLKTKLQQHQRDSLFGMETSALLEQFPEQKAAAIRSICQVFKHLHPLGEVV